MAARTSASRGGLRSGMRMGEDGEELSPADEDKKDNNGMLYDCDGRALVASGRSLFPFAARTTIGRR